MGDEPNLSPAAFGRSFRAFLEAAVAGQEVEEPPFVVRLRGHLGADPRGLPILSEQFSAIEHPNVQAALDAWVSADGRSADLLGMSAEQKRYQGLGFSDLITPPGGGLMGDRAPRPGPVDYVNVPVAHGRVRACVQHGLYLLGDGEGPLAVLVRSTGEHHGPVPQIHIEVMSAEPETASAFLAEIRAGMLLHNVYRGQLLSLGNPHGPFGEGGAMVEFLAIPEIERDAVVLPEGVLERVERHTAGFAAHAGKLLAAGRHLKRGLLLHGPPGTGKTLTAMYLVGRMPGRTTLVLSGGSYGLVSPTCELARNLQPSMVILEDVDLVAEERGMGPMGENPLLYELLNEMDGLAEDADVIFALTTNRPDLLEPALAARPGRIDQATEIPLPDAGCRRRLIWLYAKGLDLRLEDAKTVIDRTEGVSASFIKELLRRATLFSAEAGEDLVVTDAHVSEALDEMLLAGGTLTVRLLGGGPPPSEASPEWYEEGPPGGGLG
ncbi:MAG: Cell division protein FtsH [uncultured Rubrobacteraceae bacterium]|uniref:Cell division protein FtsH n=1 Tax=uncultured Rubrobacteraceae bacterium TaxID=349277 RepID=A0A6J4RDV6_9ACTN|nr:MAG: Cell division protein FtsH [uncultured Rubrobacteraceae bacterium]